MGMENSCPDKSDGDTAVPSQAGRGEGEAQAEAWVSKNSYCYFIKPSAVARGVAHTILTKVLGAATVILK